MFKNFIIKDYYIVNRDRWLNHYNKRTKILCPVCDHDYLWFDQHLKSKMHKITIVLVAILSLASCNQANKNQQKEEKRAENDWGVKSRQERDRTA